MALNNFNEEFVIMNRITIQGPAGPSNAWADGPSVKLAPSFDNSTEMKIAMAQGVKSTGWIAAPMELRSVLKFDTYLRWGKYNTYVRITDDGVHTPDYATLPMRQTQYSAELVNILPR